MRPVCAPSSIRSRTPYWLEEATGLVEPGVRALELRGRFPPAYELPLVERVLEALPADVKLIVDAWGSYTRPVALKVGAHSNGWACTGSGSRCSRRSTPATRHWQPAWTVPSWGAKSSFLATPFTALIDSGSRHCAARREHLGDRRVLVRG
jgi:hypothetical protein